MNATVKSYNRFGKSKIGIFKDGNLIALNDSNRWLALGRNIAGKTCFRHICWDCFFDKLFTEDKDIVKKARKGKWYAKIANGSKVVPAASTAPSFYFKWLFDVTDEDLELERKKFDTASKESFIRRHGEEIGLKKFETYRQRQAFTCSKEHLGLSDEEFKKFNASRASTYENFIKRYGFEIGSKRWKDYCSYEGYAGSSLSWFEDKYGKQIGLKKYNEVCSKKLSLKNYSKISQEMFAEIDKRLGEEISSNSRWEMKNHELEVFEFEEKSKKIFKLDFCLGNKAIEFNGDYWHANPKIYKPEDVIRYRNRTKTAKEIWEIDRKRLEAISKTHEVLVVWESDFKSNREKEIARCIEFLKGE